MATTQDQWPRYYEDNISALTTWIRRRVWTRSTSAARAWGHTPGDQHRSRSRREAASGRWRSRRHIRNSGLCVGWIWPSDSCPGSRSGTRVAICRYQIRPSESRRPRRQGTAYSGCLQYDLQGLRSPLPGFETCREGDHNSRIQETFASSLVSLPGPISTARLL